MGSSVGGLIKTLVSLARGLEAAGRNVSVPQRLQRAGSDTGSALPLDPRSSWDVFGSPRCPVSPSQAAEVLLGLASREEGRNGCCGKHLSVQLMGSLGRGAGGPWRWKSSAHRGWEAPRVPWPPKEKCERRGEIYGGVYPREEFPTQRFKWGLDLRDAWPQLSARPRGSLPAQLSALCRIIPFCLAVLGSVAAEGSAVIAQNKAPSFAEGKQVSPACCFLKALLWFKADGLLCFSSECSASGSHGCVDFQEPEELFGFPEYLFLLSILSPCPAMAVLWKSTW